MLYRNVAENLNRLSMAHERYRRRTGEFTFAENLKTCSLDEVRKGYNVFAKRQEILRFFVNQAPAC